MPALLMTVEGDIVRLKGALSVDDALEVDCRVDGMMDAAGFERDLCRRG